MPAEINSSHNFLMVLSYIAELKTVGESLSKCVTENIVIISVFISFFDNKLSVGLFVKEAKNNHKRRRN